MPRIRVLFAPDYRSGLPYQELLAQALAEHDIEVSFQSDYYRGLPLARGTRAAAPDIVHIHWPEKYFARHGDRWDRVRVARYPLDCWLTACYRPIVLTAHNLFPHNRIGEPGIFENVRHTVARSQIIFVHSEAARQQMREVFGVVDHRIRVIPYGDHAITMGQPLPRIEARSQLRLPPDSKVCLVFGTVSPYKGSDELVRFWAEAELPYRLVIVGPILSDEYAVRLQEIARGCPSVDLRLNREWLDEQTLRSWLSAADCAIFNYREIFTSGAAALARSYGVPLLMPSRLTTADLHEPHPHVLRFESLYTDFRAQLERALATPCDYDFAGEWRVQTSWARVAAITARAYRTTPLTSGLSITAK